MFLDIELDGFAGINDKSKASAVANVLSKVISKQNGPFTVVFWTKHREITQDVIHYCKIAGIMPITNLELDKLECMKNMYKGLPDVIDEKLKEIGALLLLIQWDNLVHKSSTEFFFDFSSLVPADEDWSKNISGILCTMAEAELGKKVSNNDYKSKAASRLLNQSFSDILQKNTDNDLACPEGFELRNQLLQSDIIAKINNWLFLDKSNQDSVRTGDVMKCENDCYITAVKKSFELAQGVKVISPIDVVITSECDIVCDKTLKDKDEKTLHRVLKGLILQSDSKLKSSQYIESFGPFYHENKVVMVYLHMGATTLVSESNLGERVFRIRRALIHDIQAKNSCYLNRIGNGIIRDR